jgi:hypothetical protein
MPTPKNIIKRIRGIPKKRRKMENPVDALRVLLKAAEERQKVYERDKIRVRDRNFNKARETRARNIAEVKIAQEEEQARQDDIQKTRIKNLRRARRKLRKLRSGEIT